jgi:hypothetical protein
MITGKRDAVFSLSFAQARAALEHVEGLMPQASSKP